MDLIRRGYALKGEIAATSVSEMVKRIKLDFAEGDLRTRLKRWCIDSRGFLVAHTYGPLDDLPTETDEAEALGDEWTKEGVLGLLDAHLVLLKRAKGGLLQVLPMTAIPPARLG